MKCKYVEDIYFFEVNTKYISSNELQNLIFSTHEMKYFWYLPKQSKFSFYFFSVKGNKLYFFHRHFTLILFRSARLEVYYSKMAYNAVLMNG